MINLQHAELLQLTAARYHANSAHTIAAGIERTTTLANAQRVSRATRALSRAMNAIELALTSSRNSI